MKHQYFRILGSVLLIIGLCSCKSDESPNSANDTFGVKSIDYVHTDKSTHDINDTKELAINSSIELHLNQNASQSFVLNNETQCEGGSLSEKVYHSQFWKDKSSVQVKDLLPIEVFKPLKREDYQIVCDFKMEIKNDLGSKTTIELKGISIKGLYGFYEMNILDHKTSQEPHYILSEKLEEDVPFDLLMGTVYLLCDDQVNSFKQDISSFKFGLIKDYEFLENDLNYCRFIYEDTEKKQRQMGRNFYLQRVKNLLSYELQFEFPQAYEKSSSINLDFSKKPFLYLDIANHFNTDSYIDVTRLEQGQIDLLAIYTQGPHSEIAWHREHISNRFQWQVDEGKVLKVSNKKLLKVPARGQVRLKALINRDALCDRGYYQGTHFNNLNDCQSTSTFHGYLVSLYELPKLKVNKLSSIKSFQWETQVIDKLLPQQSELTPYWKYHYWQGSPVTPHSCANDKKNELPEFKKITGLDNLIYQCKWN